MEGWREGGTWQPPHPPPPPLRARPRRSTRRLPGPGGGSGGNRPSPPAQHGPSCQQLHAPPVLIRMHVRLCTEGGLRAPERRWPPVRSPDAPDGTQSPGRQPPARPAPLQCQSGAVSEGCWCPRAIPAARGANRYKPRVSPVPGGFGHRVRGCGSASHHQPH